MIDLRFGRWQDVLGDVECDAWISDAPYSARTHNSETSRNDGFDPAGLRPEYDGLSEADVRAIVESWSPRCRGWMVSITDSELAPAWRQAYEDAGRCSFAPIPCVMRGMTCRMSGDGPSSWAVYALVSRPRTREFMGWGTLPGAYSGPPSENAKNGRGKPPWLLNALVRDYTRKGDLIVDPFAGWGSTLAAAIANGRRAIGAEMNPEAHTEAMKQLSRPLQVDLFGAAV